ncbi:uncharacterized protein KGF55_004954 [Candida pseudojiufengensis]|uniref:uncharacterized protein n=1 Tax=Candida pseudojiufengensis TaxID=497109 RepID=UPI00222423AA|nr:uncharacterized protein KGF55_004954 [Candida pseudojiufengensis]KAI5959722.1 hypothetical protein KGF55_004954 [Candida pseudojiufengensis]
MSSEVATNNTVTTTTDNNVITTESNSNLLSSSDALIQYCQYILEEEIDELTKLEYNKKGRKYKFINNSFQRIRQEDKHLIIYPEQPELKISFYSAFQILFSINDLLNTQPEFCCTILAIALEIEKNNWFEIENSSIIHFKNCIKDPRILKDEADEYIKQNPISSKHIEWGLNLLICSKLNFLHTDHHIGTKLEGEYMIHYINEYFGEEALNSIDILIALKSSVHWANIKGILYKLKVPNIKISSELTKNFENFPEPSIELQKNVYSRYPSGTSKYSLLKKSILKLKNFKYSKLIEINSEEIQKNLIWLFEICNDIEHDPIKYHLRSKAKQLCENPINLMDLSTSNKDKINSLFNLISIIVNNFARIKLQNEERGNEDEEEQQTEDDDQDEFDNLLYNSKFPKLEDSSKYYPELNEKLINLKKRIDQYELKNWNHDDIISRLIDGIDTENTLYSKLH